MFFTTRLGAIRRERFREIGGFQEQLVGVMNEDGDFGSRCYAAGYTSYMNARFVNLHRYPTTFLRFNRNYYRSAVVQALIDRSMDTSADKSVSRTEIFRRLFALTAFSLPALGFVLGLPAALGMLLVWVALFLSSFGAMSRLIWRNVPRRSLVQWYLMYIAITPSIFAGYLHGLLLHVTKRSLLAGPPSDMDFFS
jgi:hypothetical protein